MGPQLVRDVNDKCSKRECLATGRARRGAITSSARGKNTTSDGRRVHLAEREVGASLPSSRTMPAWILDSPRNQTPPSAAQSTPPTGGNRLWQQAVGRAGGEGRSGAGFRREPPSGREALPWLRLSKGCSPWCVQASQTDVIVPSLPRF